MSAQAPNTTVYPQGLKNSKSDLIKTIETFRVRPRWLFVRVETEKGIVGWGEATLEGHSEAVEGAFADLRSVEPLPHTQVGNHADPPFLSGSLQ